MLSVLIRVSLLLAGHQGAGQNDIHRGHNPKDLNNTIIRRSFIVHLYCYEILTFDILNKIIILERNLNYKLEIIMTGRLGNCST